MTGGRLWRSWPKSFSLTSSVAVLCGQQTLHDEAVFVLRLWTAIMTMPATCFIFNLQLNLILHLNSISAMVL